MPRGYSSKGANTSRAKTAKKPDEQVRDWKYNAEEYSDIKKGDGWVFARLVACSVRPGDGQGSASVRTDGSKVSASTFAKAAHTSHNTVLAYLELWKAAYDDPEIPEVWIDPDKCEPWQAADDELELPKVDFKVYRAERRAITLTAPQVEVVKLPIEDRPLAEPEPAAVKGTPKPAKKTEPDKPAAVLEFVSPDVATGKPEATVTPLRNSPDKIVEADEPTPANVTPIKPAANSDAPLRDFMIKRFNEWDDYTEKVIREANADELRRFVNHLRRVADQINGRLSN